MGNIEKYYKNTENALPHPFVQKFINMGIKPDFAIDLGCGAGRDTKFLVQNDIAVTAIDRIDVTKFLYKDLTEEEKARLTFEQAIFSEAHLPKTDLVISYEALPFCNKEALGKLLDKIKDSLNENGYFLCNFFGKNDSWFGNDKIQFYEKEEIEYLLKDFKILKLNEIERDGESAMHQMKHWHVFWVIAKKESMKG